MTIQEQIETLLAQAAPLRSRQTADQKEIRRMNIYQKCADLYDAMRLAEELREALYDEPELREICMHMIACLDAKTEIATDKRDREFKKDAATDDARFQADRAAAKQMRQTMRHTTQ